jgi:hypothetical protein
MPDFLVIASRVEAAVESYRKVRDLLNPADVEEWKAGFEKEQVSTPLRRPQGDRSVTIFL